MSNSLRKPSVPSVLAVVGQTDHNEPVRVSKVLKVAGQSGVENPAEKLKLLEESGLVSIHRGKVRLTLEATNNT